MIDVKLLLNDFDLVAKNLENRNVSKKDLESLREFVQVFKKLKADSEFKRARQNVLSKEYAKMMRVQNRSEKPRDGISLDDDKNGAELKKENKAHGDSLESDGLQGLRVELENLKAELKKDLDSVALMEVELNQSLLTIPNMLDPKTPVGKDESENVEIKKVLSIPAFSFKPKEHWELAQKNGWIDFKTGAKLSGSRFAVLRGMGARLNQALISYMLDFNYKNGFEICSVPVLVNESAMLGTGQFPKFIDDVFKVSDSLESSIVEEVSHTPLYSGKNLYLIPTSEISLTNLYQDEIIDSTRLPIMLTATTPCFRKEAGSAGRDTRGIIRQHQFDKVELVAITSQEDSEAIHQKMVEVASSLLESLELPHRLVQLCSGDIGFSAYNTIDLEVWLPGQGCYREISSVSNCWDFQARRAKIRYKDYKDSKNKGKNKLAHTLNGSSLAVGRTLVAIMENFQKEDGDIQIPRVLERYL